jgi:hypothetical protein
MRRVVISREWHNPHVTIQITDRSISLDMPLTDYIEALVLEMGNPATLLTQAALRKRLFAASEVVNRKMKHETSKVL